MSAKVMEQEVEYKDYTIGLALFDFVPVVLFLISGVLVWAMYGSPVFLAGVIACFAGGMCKAVWKVIAVRKGQDRAGLTNAFRHLMVGGFALMLLSLIISLITDRHEMINGLKRAMTLTPAALLIALGFAGMCLMGYFCSHMDNSARSNWIEEITNALSQLAVLTGVVILYFGLFYYATDAARTALESTDAVQVTESEQGYLFDGPETEDILVFYQGAKVEEEAYAPLMKTLSENGLDCFLCRMPYNFALFDEDLAGDVREKLTGAGEGAEETGYSHWYIGGHSLGGVAASDYLAKLEGGENADAAGWNGIIFLASYPAKKISAPAFLITASRDGIMSQKSLNKSVREGLWPDSLTRYTVYGGNHAGFGTYGQQTGDGTAAISPEEQQRQTAEMIIYWITEQKTAEGEGVNE